MIGSGEIRRKMPLRRPSRKASLTRRSSPLWKLMMATTPPGVRQVGNDGQQAVEIGQFAVDQDAQGLEGAGGRMQLGAGGALEREIAGLADDGGELLGGGDRPQLCARGR